MNQRPRFLLEALVATLLGLGAKAAIAAPFGVPFIELPQGSAGNGGDTSAYFGLQLDPITFNPVYPSPNIYDCPKSPAGGSCRTDFINYDTRYRYDSVRWRMFDGGRTGLIDNLSWKDGGLDMFRKIYFGYAYSATAPGNVEPAFSQPINFSLYSDYSGRSSPTTFQLTTEAIFLDHVKLNLDGVTSGAAFPLDLVFDGPNPSINLSNSSLSVGLGHLQVNGLGRFSINALEGINSIEQLGHSTIINAPAAINISPGAWLTFSDFSKGLEFRGKNNSLNVVGLNQDGGLELKRGKLRFDNGLAQFSQGATLHLVGSETSATFDSLRFSSGAKLALGNRTSLEASAVAFSGAAATIGEGASLTAKAIQVTGNDRIDSGDPNRSLGLVQTGFLGIFDESRLELNSVADFKVRGSTEIGNGLAPSGNGAVFNLNRSTVTAYESVVMSNGSELNLTNQATFTLRPDQGSHEIPDARIYGTAPVGAAVGNPARIHVGPTAALNVVYGGQIDLSDEFLRLKVDRTGALEVKGNLRGSGQIEGDGAVSLLAEGKASGQKVSGGWLYPGTLAQPIATLSIDPQLYFGQGSQLRVNVGRDAQGQLAYGKVLYGAGDVTLDGTVTLTLATVRGQAPLSATELNGKSITLLSARDAAVSGTIRPSIYKPVVDVSAMPALLSWRVVDLQTNQHPDITLEADLQPYSALQKDGGLKTNRGRGLGLMVAAATQNPNGPIAGALNTLTNSQLGVSGTVTPGSGSSGTPSAPQPLPTPAQAQGTPVAQQNSWHPEPYSSYIATGFAQVANLRNMVFERAALTNASGTQVWMDTAGFRGSIDGQGDLGSYGYHMSQWVLGKDMGPIWGGAWGAYLAVNDRKLDVSDLQTQDISGTTAGLGAYWRHQGETWTTLAQWGFAHGWHDSVRQSTVAGQSAQLRAKYSSDSTQAAVRFSAPWFDYKGIEVSHEIGGSVSVYRQDGFDETGDPDFAFRLKAATAEAYIGHVGAHVRFPSLPFQAGLRPIAFGRFEHDFANNSDHAIKASLLANPQSYEQFVGQGRGPNSRVFGVGLMTDSPGPWQVQTGVSYSRHTYGHDWGAGLDIRYSW